MKILVGYNGGEVGRLTLSLARDYAQKNNAFVYVITSMEGEAQRNSLTSLRRKKALNLPPN